MDRIKNMEFYRKIIDRIKSRCKKKWKCNWPELDTYCGCCNLTTGIYIRTVIALVMTALSIAGNSIVLRHIVEIKPFVFGTNTTAMNSLKIESSNPPEDLSTFHAMYNGVISYYILWLSYKVIYVSLLLWTLFAVFKRNGNLLKILLYISIPNLILDIFTLFFGMVFLKFIIKTLFVLCILSEIYNILALNSEYKNIMGKSKVRHKDIESELGTPSMPPFISPPYRDLRYLYNQVHCRGCTCTANEPPNNGHEVVSVQPSSAPVQNTLLEDKEIDENELNYAITGILNPRNPEVTARSEMDGTAGGQRSVRPNTLDLTLNMGKDEKFLITDEPIIYDVNQLNVGMSPVIEDREK